MIGLHARAARGDVTAQRVLAALALDNLIEGRVETESGFQLAEHWARLAAAHGLPEDLNALSTLLLARSGFVEGVNEHLADLMAAEAVSLLNNSADQGDEGAADCLANVGTALRPAAFALARQFAGGQAQRTFA